MADYIFYGFFVASKEGKTGLTVTVDVFGPGGTEASAQPATEVGGGLYKYSHTDATDGDYIAVFKTADTSVDAKHVPALATKQLSAYMDAKVSSRMEAASYVDHTAAIAAVQSTADDIETAVGALVAPDNVTIGAIDAAVTALAGVVGGIDTRVPADPASDTTVLTRFAAADYVAPDNATIGGTNTMVAAIDNYLQDEIAKDTEVAAVKAVVDDIETAVASVPTAVWAFGQRTTTTPAASVSSAAEDGKITRPRGDTWTIAITGLGSLTDNTKVWFTVKSSPDDDDSEALLQIEKTAGLVYLNGAAGTSTDATLTVTDAAAGNITIVVKPASTALLPLGTWYYDVQALFTTVVTTAGAGRFVVSSDITRATA